MCLLGLAALNPKLGGITSSCEARQDYWKFLISLVLLKLLERIQSWLLVFSSSLYTRTSDFDGFVLYFKSVYDSVQFSVYLVTLVTYPLLICKSWLHDWSSSSNLCSLCIVTVWSISVFIVFFLFLRCSTKTTATQKCSSSWSHALHKASEKWSWA